MGEKTGRAKYGALTAAAITLVLYVPSSGPTAQLVLNRRISIESYNFAYAPVLAAESWSATVWRLMHRWRSLWVDPLDWMPHDPNSPLLH